MRKNYCLKKCGFTLVELLVVIVIIGILVSITFTGASYLLGSQEEKQAASQIEAISLALEQYRSDMGTYPKTDEISGSDDEYARGIFLYLALAGVVDGVGNTIDSEDRGKSFLPGDSITLGVQNGNRNEVTTLSDEELSDSSGSKVFPMDPWFEPFIYEYPRRDGHRGFLLFSKGPDGQASVFEQELTSTPNKEVIDEDNIPATEPGKW